MAKGASIEIVLDKAPKFELTTNNRLRCSLTIFNTHTKSEIISVPIRVVALGSSEVILN